MLLALVIAFLCVHAVLCCALQASGSGLFFNVSVSDCCLMRVCGIR